MKEKLLTKLERDRAVGQVRICSFAFIKKSSSFSL